MTTADLIVIAHETAHPDDSPSAEHAALIDELADRLARLSVWRERMTAAVNQHLIDDDGSDLTPDHVRVSNMLSRLSSANDQNTRDGSVEPSDLLNEWDVGADGIPVRKGDHVVEEDGELVYLHKDGRKTYFV